MYKNPWSLAASLVFLSSKVQVSWLFILALLPHLWVHWPRPTLFRAALVITAFCLPFLLWKGTDWLGLVSIFPHQSLYNLSFHASLLRLGTPVWLAWLSWFGVFIITLACIYRVRSLNPLNSIGYLTAASPLLAPYAGISTLIAPLILSVIPFAAAKPWPRILLVLLYHLPMALFWDFRMLDVYAYFTGVLLLTWAWLAWVALADERS